MRLLLPVAALWLLAWTPLPRTSTTPVPLTLPQPVEGLGRFARAASDGRGFFVTSSDASRRERLDYIDTRFTPQYGIALDGRGEILGDEVSSSGNANGLSAVASSGANYLVVWQARADGLVYARRVNRDGRPIDHAPIVVYDESAPSAVDVSVAWNGSHYVVAFEKRRGLFAAQLVSETGHLIGASFTVGGSEVAANARGTVLFATHQADEIDEERTLIVESFPRGPVEIGRGAQAVLSASSGEEFLVAYHYEGDVWAQRLDQTAQPIGAPVKLANRASAPSVTWIGDHWLVAFTKDGTSPSVQGVRVTRDSLLDAAPFTIAANASFPAVASNGSRVLVTWLRESDGRRDKAMLDGTAVSGIGPLNRQLAAASVARIAAMDDTTVIAQTRNAIYGEVDVWTARGTVVKHVMTVPGPVHLQAVAASSSHALIAVSTAEALRFYVIDAVGNILGESTLESRSEPFTGRAYWTGSQYFVTWAARVDTYDSVTYSTTVDANGQAGRRRSVIDEAVIAAVDDRMLISWRQTGFSFAGTISGPGNTVVPIREEKLEGSEASWPLKAATDGSGFLVLVDTESDRLTVQRVEFDGTRGSARSVPAPPVPSRLPFLDLQWNGESFLLLAYSPGEPRIFAMRIEPDGRLIDREFIPLATVPGLAYGNLPAVLVRGPQDIEIVSATPAQPFGSPGKTWRRLGGAMRRRAVQ